MRTYIISHSRSQGFELKLVEYPTWKYCMDIAWSKLCELTGGWIGGHGLPEIFGEIPVGRRKYYYFPDGEPLLENSVMMKLIEFESWVLLHLADYREEDVLDSFPISDETARKLDKSFYEAMTGMD